MACGHLEFLRHFEFLRHQTSKNNFFEIQVNESIFFLLQTELNKNCEILQSFTILVTQILTLIEFSTHFQQYRK
jgi:hypothetical protein